VTAVQYERRGRAAWITLDSPANRNALSAPLVRELGEHLKAAIADPEVRVMVVTGNGPAFCAGADLKSRGDAVTPAPLGRPEAGDRRGQRPRLRRRGRPRGGG
jgi:methylglutaconyl-CoA hydratase